MGMQHICLATNIFDKINDNSIIKEQDGIMSQGTIYESQDKMVFNLYILHKD